MTAVVAMAGDEKNLYIAKLEQAELELREKNQGRSEVIDKLRKLRGDKAKKIADLKVLNGENMHFRILLDETKEERESLQKALGRLGGKGEYGLCSSEEELNHRLKRLEHRIQHETIPLAEEKQIVREMKKLEATRPQVVSNAAARAKIKESLGEKDAIESKLKLLKLDMDTFYGSHQVVLAERKKTEEEKRVIDQKIKAAEVELDAVTEEKQKAYQNYQELRKRFPRWFNDYKSSSRQVKPVLTERNDGVAAAVVEKEAEKAKSEPEIEVVVVVDEPDFYVPDKKHDDMDVSEAVVDDQVKLKEMRREQEIAKAKLALERKKKRAAAKVARRVQKEADKKQKAAAEETSKTEAESGKCAADDDEPKETEAELEMSEASKNHPMLKRGVRPDLLRKNYWKQRVYCAGAAITGLLAAVGYYFLSSSVL